MYRFYRKRSKADLVASALSIVIVDCNARCASKFFSVPGVRVSNSRRCKNPRALF